MNTDDCAYAMFSIFRLLVKFLVIAVADKIGINEWFFFSFADGRSEFFRCHAVSQGHLVQLRVLDPAMPSQFQHALFDRVPPLRSKFSRLRHAAFLGFTLSGVAGTGA